MTSPIDGAQRLFGYRRLAAYPSLVATVGLSMDQVRAAWWRIVWIIAARWTVATGGVGRTCGDVRPRIDRASRYPRPLQHAVQGHSPSDGRDGPQYHALLAVNDAAVEEYGWSREDFLALTANDLYLPEDAPVVSTLRQEKYIGR